MKCERALVACAIILQRDIVDNSTRERVLKNRDFAKTKFEEQSPSKAAGFNEGTPKIAFVTPYFKEQETKLRRCLDSVQHQTIKSDHIFIADGQ